MDDSLGLDRLRLQGGISGILARPLPVPEQRESDETGGLPEPGGEYYPHARAANQPLIGLNLLFKDRTIENYQYGELSSRSCFVPADAAGNLILLHFTGPGLPEVLITGRNLRPLFDLLTQHRISWVAELPGERDFLEPAATVITRIVARLAGMASPG